MDPDRIRFSPAPQFVVVTLFLGFLATTLRTPYFVGIFNDDACYVLRAFFLANGGDCLVCERPLSQGSDFALGWPLILAPLALLAKGELWVYQSLAWLLTLCSGCLLGLLGRRYFGDKVGWLCAALFFFSLGSAGFAASTMSEPLFVFLICALLGLEYLAGSSGKVTWLYASVAGWCLVTRTEGIAILAAAMAAGLVARRWQRAAALVALSLPCWWLVTSWRPRSSPHWTQIQEFFHSGSLDYPKRWLEANLELIAECYLGALGGAGEMLVLGLGPLAVLGWFRWWKRDPGVGPWLALALPGALFFWPYLHLRYWYPLLPVAVIGLAFALPARFRAAGLALLVTLQFAGVVAAPRVDRTPTVQLYEALRTTPEDTVITCQYDCRVHVFSHRATVSPAGVSSLAEMLVFMASQESQVVIWEKSSTLISDVRGNQQGRFVPDLDLWLARCPLLTTLASTPAGVVCKLSLSYAQVTEAFSLYQKGYTEPTVSQRLSSVERCIELYPDFPGTKMLWVELAMQSAVVDRVKVESYVVSHVREYPHDFAGAFLGMQILQALPGTPEGLALVFESTRDEARRLGRRDVLEALQSVKGGAREGDERPTP